MIKLEVKVYVENVNGCYNFSLQHDETGPNGYIYSSDVVYDKFKRGVFIPMQDGSMLYYPHHRIKHIEYNVVK